MNWTMQVGEHCFQVILLPSEDPNQFQFLIEQELYSVEVGSEGEHGWRCCLNEQLNRLLLSQCQPDGSQALVGGQSPANRQEQGTVWLGCQAIPVRWWSGTLLAGASCGAGAPLEQQVICAPMPGKIVSLHVQVEQMVEANASLMVLEAMKMENELRAPGRAVVEKVLVQAGDVVEAGAPLLALMPSLPEQASA